MNPTRSDVAIYTDGGAIGNPGPGGFGVVVEVDGKVLNLSRGYRRTTNNRMELMAAIAGLESTADLANGRRTEVVSDSSYVVNGISKGWAARWRANGWKRNKQGDMALNADLWARLLDATEARNVAFRWVKGHAGHPQNERCDALAREASSLPKSKQLVDDVYEGASTGKNSPKSAAFESLMQSADAPPNEDEPPREDRDENVDTTTVLTHIDSSGEARMVDVGSKAITDRVASAGCDVLMSPRTLSLIRAGKIGKGDVISTAKLAGVMGGKRTAELIPMCHNIPISQIEVDISELSDGTGLQVQATARATWRTGVEMEAMTATSIAALTIYDMCKSAERGIQISNLRLLSKSGGIHGDYVA